MHPVIIVVVAMFIPIVAIIGGITAAIFRTHGQQRIAELAMKERIAAIEKGLDPSRLPPLPSVADPGELRQDALDARDREAQKAQGLLIGGLVTLAVGIGIGILLDALPTTGPLHLWAVGLIPGLVGVALLFSSWLVRPRPAAASPRT